MPDGETIPYTSVYATLGGDVSLAAQIDLLDDMTSYAYYDIVSIAVFALFTIFYKRKVEHVKT